jgi:hypothetical protein
MQTKTRFRGGHTKFLAWGFTEYERVVFMDSDVTVLGSLDPLLRFDHFTGSARLGNLHREHVKAADSLASRSICCRHRVAARSLVAAAPSLSALQWLLDPLNLRAHFNWGVFSIFTFHQGLKCNGAES